MFMAGLPVTLHPRKLSLCKAVSAVRRNESSSRNMKRSGELMGIDMIFVNAKSSLMPATVNFNRLPTFRRRLKAGALFTISGFDVTRCNQNVRLTDSSLTIRFSDATTFDELTEPPINKKSVHRLSDIVGELTDGNDRVMATLNINNSLGNDVSVTMSLFDSQAVSFHNKLEVFQVDPRVVVVNSIHKIVGGIFLNYCDNSRMFALYSETYHMYIFDKETAAGGSDFTRNQIGTDFTMPSPARKIPPRKVVARGDHTCLAPSTHPETVRVMVCNQFIHFLLIIEDFSPPPLTEATKEDYKLSLADFSHMVNQVSTCLDSLCIATTACESAKSTLVQDSTWAHLAQNFEAPAEGRCHL
ncbi:hypothetical protein HID58_062392 [Brassica napus]|uniref:Replication protein A 70 kDa DNA-binding subunit B/D first OB fold domain-containing protein n=1 Tax=Brassica napus TaxID=3708 RepID=A0ABQ8A284_BRANA|nr:hypothetical protein HID58_062392 [Brassica napus]